MEKDVDCYKGDYCEIVVGIGGGVFLEVEGSGGCELFWWFFMFVEVMFGGFILMMYFECVKKVGGLGLEYVRRR